MVFISFMVFFIFSLMILYHYLPFKIWELGTIIYLLSTLFMPMPWALTILLWVTLGSIIMIYHMPQVREKLTYLAFQHAVRKLPQLSKTEEETLNTGDTWFEKSLFQGNPDWKALKKTKAPLTKEEIAFIENETHELCHLLDEWSIWQDKDLPPTVWQLIKTKGFLGLVIDKKYGGKGFSARAHSEIILKLASRCSVGVVTVMVPNSLGPGELLQHYGTDEQKSYFLPKLAKGELIPCFALTEPGAGSDATSIESEALVIEKTIKGKKALYLSLTLNKRWITLSPIATLIGLAVQLKDPMGLLKGVGEEGITCLLISRDVPNLEIGNRHFPAESYFMNGSIRGKDIIVPIDAIIGGQKNAGRGWKMLFECLSIGRSISLPALATGSSSLAYITTGAYSRIRRQFGLELAQFEGIQEKLAEIAGLNYLMNATRMLTVCAVQKQMKPSVASGITKFLNTELARIVVNHAMDIHAGRTVVTGPNNYLFPIYQGIPISITVEGANIMTRNLLIFGQGSMACHPFLRDEFYAIRQQQPAQFQTLCWQHLRYLLSNLAKTICSAWTAGYLLSGPQHALKREAQKLTYLSQSFALLSDMALLLLGGQLKRKERLSARLADAMVYLYAALACLYYFESEGSPAADLLHARWALHYAFYQIQYALIELCRHLPMKPLGMLLRLVAFPFGQTMKKPADILDEKLAHCMASNNTYRDKLKQALYLSGKKTEPVDKIEFAFQLLTQHEALYKEIHDLKRYKFSALKQKLNEKLKKGQLNSTKVKTILEVEQARWDAEQVDEFPFQACINKHDKIMPIHAMTHDLNTRPAKQDEG